MFIGLIIGSINGVCDFITSGLNFWLLCPIAFVIFSHIFGMYAENACYSFTRIRAQKILALDSLAKLQYGVFCFGITHEDNLKSCWAACSENHKRKPWELPENTFNSFIELRGVSGGASTFRIIKLPFITLVYINDFTINTRQLTDTDVEFIDRLIKRRISAYEEAFRLNHDTSIQTWMK